MKKLIALLIFSMFLISLVSAWELNPFAVSTFTDKQIKTDTPDFLKKDFNIEYGIIKISDTILWIPTDKIAEYSLTESEDSLLNAYAKGKAVLYKDSKLFDEATFKDLEGITRSLRDVQYFILINESYEVEDNSYIEVCGEELNKNNTKICKWEVDKYKNKTEYRTYWKPYNFEELKADNYEWKLEAKKNYINQKIDFIPIAQTKELSAWVWWSSSWAKKKAVNISTASATGGYYSVLIPVTYDGDMKTDFSDLRFINSAEDTELGYWINNKTDSTSANVWVNTSLTQNANVTIYMYYGNAGASTTSNRNNVFKKQESHGYIIATAVDDQTAYSGIQVVPDTSIFVSSMEKGASVTANVTQILDASKNLIATSGTIASNIGTFNNPYRLASATTYFLVTSSQGSTYTRKSNSAGSFPQDSGVFSWNNGLNWNGDVANPEVWFFNIQNVSFTIDASPSIYFGAEINGDELPIVTLNAPVNALNSTNQTILFNCTASDNINLMNVTLKINNTNNGTNTSGINNTAYLFSRTLADGFYNWSCTGTDNISQSTTPTARIFSINTTPFIEFLTPPTLIDHANITQEYIPMKVNISTLYFKNITYYLENTNGTFYTQIYTNTTYDINFTDIPDAHYHYNVTICTTTDKCNTTETRHINHDNSPPDILVTGGNGTQNSGKLSVNHTLNYTITDLHLSACLLNYNSTNRTIPCTSGATNTTNFILQVGVYNATIWANDTYNNTYGRFVEWDYNIFENSRTYSNTTIETFTEAFSLNISLGSGVTISSAYLNYNGTDYGSSIATSGDYKIINNNINIPNVSADTNISFYWKLTLSSGNFNTSSSNQTISTLAIDNCGVFTHVILNYTIYDEDTRVFLPTATYNTSANLFVKISGDFSGGVFEYYSGNILTNPIQVCTSNALASGKNYKLDAEIQYFSADRVSEYHYIENYSLNTTIGTLNISLYDLLINNSQEFLVTFKDNNFIPVQDALIELSRQYLSIGGFLSVEIMKTDNDGKTIGHFVLNDEVYTIYVKKNGVLLAVYENVRAFCSDLVTGDCRINLNQAGSTSNPRSFESNLGVIGLETYNDTSKIYTFEFTTEDSSTKTINVTIFNYPNLNETICSEVLSSSSGTISCTIPPAYYNNSALAVITIDGEEYSSSIFQIILDSFSEVSSMKFFLAFLMIVSIPFLAMTSGPMMLLLFIIGLVASVSLGLLDLGGFIGPFSAFLWILVATIILMVKASERRQQQ